MQSVPIWSATLAAIQNQISQQNFDIWFSQLSCQSADNGELHLIVPNQYFQDWLDENYRDLILGQIKEQTGQTYSLIFHLKGQSQNATTTPGKATQPARQPVQATDPGLVELNKLPFTNNINPHQTFDTFVVGSSNQFAHAATMAVATNPARTYNPLFIFGGVGLGKTHLLHAIGNSIISRDPSARISYLSSEEFVNELINSIRLERMNEFRTKYRTHCDALLVDDIQFLAGKIRTQEEFFYTFNALHSSGKQIVVTSDKFPKEIPGLEERLRNRFEWGLIADIQPPDDETKVAIMQKKAEREGFVLPDNVCHYIASNVKSNIRELEGILVRLQASALFFKQDIDLEFTKRALENILGTIKPTVNIEAIQEASARFFNIKPVEIRSHRKLKQIVWPRQLAMYLCRRHTERSFPEIGQAFGGRDHTTVIHAVKKIEKLLQKDPSVADVLKSIEKTLGI